ncbi:hypothetical protein HN876_01980 [archaeon]|jgi:hypothetical protein|nr:hypothetical protein [archaeon]MBT7251660.1 hypothetical protein [archaeon]
MMAHGGDGARKTKGDLKRKRLNRGYKRGGKFRTHNISEEGNVVSEETSVKVNGNSEKKLKSNKNKKSKKIS